MCGGLRSLIWEGEVGENLPAELAVCQVMGEGGEGEKGRRRAGTGGKEGREKGQQFGRCAKKSSRCSQESYSDRGLAECPGQRARKNAALVRENREQLSTSSLPLPLLLLLLPSSFHKHWLAHWALHGEAKNTQQPDDPKNDETTKGETRFISVKSRRWSAQDRGHDKKTLEHKENLDLRCCNLETNNWVAWK